MELSEALKESQHGTSAVLSGIAVALALNVVIKVIQILWDIFKKKSERSEKNIEKLILSLRENTQAVELLGTRLKSVENEFPVIKKNLNRAFVAVKFLAGDKWQAIKIEMDEDGFIS